MVDRMPLVLVPGSLCDAGQWAPQIEALNDIAQARVVSWPSGCDSVPAMADAVLRSAEAERFVLAGFSLGGFVALEIMRCAPERVLGLMLLDSSAQPDAAGNQSVRAANLELFATEPQVVLDRFAALTCGPATPDSVAETVRASMRRHGPARYAAEQRAIMTRPDARAVLGKIGCPTLVLCGGEDRATPPAVNREMASSIKAAYYVELPGIGHMTTLEAPRAVSEAMRELFRKVIAT